MDFQPFLTENLDLEAAVLRKRLELDFWTLFFRAESVTAWPVTVYNLFMIILNNIH